MHPALRFVTLCPLVACSSCGDTASLELSLDRAGEPLRWSASVSVLQSGRAECDVRELARLPDARSDTPSVQHYASVISEEHGTLFSRLQRLLQARGEALPYVMSAEGTRQREQLDAEVGSAFDRAYLAGQVQLQQEAQATLGELEADRDGGLRGWAQEAAGMWARDEQWARQIYASILIDGL